jgi:hypothetical protein
MKVLISCTENPINFIKVLDELELFKDNKVIFDEKQISVGPPSAVCRPPSAVRRLSTHFVIRITFFRFNLDISLFRLRFFELNLSSIVFQAPGANSVR